MHENAPYASFMIFAAPYQAHDGLMLYLLFCFSRRWGQKRLGWQQLWGAGQLWEPVKKMSPNFRLVQTLLLEKNVWGLPPFFVG
jgi:hypothetical protein